MTFSGLLKGNIDEQGRLEDNDFLDDESKRNLGALSYLGGADINVRGLLTGEEDEGAPDLKRTSESVESGIKSADAVSIIDSCFIFEQMQRD